jgi:uncharacterized protein (TIGR00255 family)
MTGFGRAAGENTSHSVTVVARGVNHRFLDLRLRLDDALAESEPPLRELFSAKIRRGRVDVKVDVRRLGPRRLQVELQRDVLTALQSALEQLEADGWGRAHLQAADLLRLPEVLSFEAMPDTWTEEDQELLLRVAGEALAQLAGARGQEGERLAAVLHDGLDRLATLTQGLEEQRRGAVQELRESFEKRLAELLGDSSLDPGRLEQEVAVLVDRTDIREELDRLAGHLSHFRSLLEQSGSIGKRLDFLAQEILREINTLGAKCRHGDMIRSVLEAKTVAEQLREQIQNVE